MESRKMRSLNEINPSRFIIASLFWVFLWPSENSSMLYRICGYVFQGMFFLFYTFFKCVYAFTTTSMEEIVLCSFVSLTEVALFVKVLNMRYRMQLFQTHLRELHNFVLESEEELALILGRCRILTKMLFAYIGLVMVTGVMSYSVPFFLEAPTLPYLGWYPFDWYHNRQIYWLIYAYQVTGMIIQSHTLVCMEMYMVYLFVILSTQFDILSLRLKNVGWNELCRDSEQMDVSDSEKRAKTKLINCVRAHRTIAG